MTRQLGRARKAQTSTPGFVRVLNAPVFLSIECYQLSFLNNGVVLHNIQLSYLPVIQ